jgi:hypothetical protein
MAKNILLVEPGYKTKFPPMGLMKISTYHKTMGDNVTFVKGIRHSTKYSVYFDRIYISTLFTYNWDVTTKTINYYKELVNNDTSRIIVGGVMASLMPDEVHFETGILPIIGLLDRPGMLDDGNDIIIDSLIPDYNLFTKPQIQLSLFDPDDDKYDYSYSLIKDSYFGYSTRGCIRKCKFCGVHRIEPKYVDYIDLKPYVSEIKNKYNEKYHLVLFDNNVLASNAFSDIIRDIKELGFEKGSIFKYRGKAGQEVRRRKSVDFNQGVDAKLICEREAKIELLSQICITPLRIAFDHIAEKKIYVKAVKLAAKYGIRDLSNYILYNWNDTPDDLWNRLKVNIDLNKELDLSIYSFPMKFIPLFAKNRSHVSDQWNWWYIRGVQRILNVLKGSVMTTEDFFYRAFGSNPCEFKKILLLPEAILMSRDKQPWYLEQLWDRKFEALKKANSNFESYLLETLNEHKSPHDLKLFIPTLKSKKLKDFLGLYLMTFDDVKIMKNN